MNDLIDIEVLISKFLSGEATPDEAILLEDWKHKDVLNQLYYTDCERAFHAINGTEPDYSVIDTEDAWKKVDEELAEFHAETDLDKKEQELGDVFFSLIN